MKTIYKDADKTVLEGAETLYNAVKTTLGPRGKNVLIRNADDLTITHDGVTVANAINPDDDSVYGVKLIKQASNKMNDEAGDGTTTVTVLAYHILKELQALSAPKARNWLQAIFNRNAISGINAMSIRKELEEVSGKLVQAIKDRTINVTQELLEHVTTISAADAEIGKLVAEVVGAVGSDGMIVTELTPSLSTTYELVDGCRLPYGFTSAHFANEGKTTATLDKPLVLVYNGKISSFQDLLPIMNKLTDKQLNTLAIFCEEISTEALANLILNKSKGVFISSVTEIPVYSSVTLGDVAALTNSHLVDRGAGVSLQDATVEHLGSAERVVASATDTSIIGASGDITEYKTTLADDERSEARIAILEGRAAIIKIGGVNETDIEEKNYRIEDAIMAAKAAVRGGIVAGGGTTLVAIAQLLEDTPVQNALRKALYMPYTILLENANIDYVEPVENLVLNVTNGKSLPVLESGIIDPSEVTQQAVQTAISVASISVTTGVIIDSTILHQKE